MSVEVPRGPFLGVLADAVAARIGVDDRADAVGGRAPGLEMAHQWMKWAAAAAPPDHGPP